MSERRGKKKSCSCYLCKPWKFAGNTGDSYTGSRHLSEMRRYPGEVTRSQRMQAARREMENN